MEKVLDCRGLACPAPVLKTKALIEMEHPNLVEIRVDNAAARENVSRFLNSKGFEVSIEERGTEFQITGRRGGESEPVAAASSSEESPELKKIMVMIATDRIGKGDDELGLKLMASFLKTLKEMGPELWRLVLLNSGVKLTVEDSEFLPSLQDLNDQGVAILVCGTCLTHFGLMERKRVGETTNMLDIVTSMQVADKVISV